MLPKIKDEIEQLDLAELQDLAEYLQQLISQKGMEQAEATDSQNDDHNGHAPHRGQTFRWERVRCGKANCKCARGELHGPYLYAYWTESGRTRSKYIGNSGKHRCFLTCMIAPYAGIRSSRRRIDIDSTA